MRPWKSIAVLACGSACIASWGQAGSDGGNDWRQVCQQAKTTPVQEPKLDGPQPVSKLATCNEQDLYYGFHGTPDYAAALQCGWYELAHPKPSEANMFYGPGVLTMLYANGQGVSRDYDAAIHFACDEDWASDAELELRVGHLEALRDGRAERTHFDLCDDITSGLSMGACTAIQTSRADAKREDEIEAIAAKLPPSAKAAFERLRTSEAAFEDARAGNEIDMTGSARGMFWLQERKRLRDQFLVNLQRFANGDVPNVSNAELGQLDAALNSVFQDIERAPADHWRYATIKPEGIRDTERRWVALEEAWREFSKEAYPNLDFSAVRAQLIRLRLHQLRSLAPKD